MIEDLVQSPNNLLVVHNNNQFVASLYKIPSLDCLIAPVFFLWLAHIVFRLEYETRTSKSNLPSRIAEAWNGFRADTVFLWEVEQIESQAGERWRSYRFIIHRAENSLHEVVLWFWKALSRSYDHWNLAFKPPGWEGARMDPWWYRTCRSVTPDSPNYVCWTESVPINAFETR